MAPKGVETATEAISFIKQKELWSICTLSYMQVQKCISKQGIAQGPLVHWDIIPLISREKCVWNLQLRGAGLVFTFCDLGGWSERVGTAQKDQMPCALQLEDGPQRSGIIEGLLLGLFFFFFKTIDYNPLGSSLPLKWVLLMWMKIEWDSESWPRQVQVTVWEAWLHWCSYIPSGHPITHILLSPCSLNFSLGATHICVRTLLDVLGQFCGTVSEKFCQFQSLSRCGQFPVDLPCSATPIHTTAVWLLSMLSLPRGIFPDSWYL